MRMVSSFSASISLLFLVISISSVTFFQTSDASAQQCLIRFSKVAPGSGDTLFSFERSADGGQPQVSSIPAGLLAALPFSSTAVLTELETPGWRFVEVRCESDSTNGVTFEITDNTITAECNTGDFSEGFCTFFNLRDPASIPTMSEWGMISAAAGLVLVGVFFAIRKRKVRA
jgi:hypothetical protein